MSTIRDVARRAGVSTMTVSRVINNSGYIGKETRERVEAAIAELGYVPNALARSLRFKQTKTLALVLTDITNPFFTTIARGVEDAASAAGFNVILCNTDESAAEESEYLRILLQKQVDGVLLVPARSRENSVNFLLDHGVPVVVLDRRVPEGHVDVVRGESEHSAFLLVRHLIELGHRRIAALSGPAYVSTAVDRVAGYRRALSEAGLTADDELIYHHEYTLEAGYQMALAALRADPQPTALFAGNNFIAIGAYRALRSAGLSVPGDVSLVAFDDLPMPLVLDPFLTVAAQPAYEMGQRATELLLARLEGRPVPGDKGGGGRDCQEIVLPSQIIIRQSSGPVKSGQPAAGR